MVRATEHGRRPFRPTQDWEVLLGDVAFALVTLADQTGVDTDRAVPGRGRPDVPLGDGPAAPAAGRGVLAVLRVTAVSSAAELIVGTGAGARPAAADMVLNIGPQHPSTHGVLRLRLVLDGERVVSAEPIIGYMHRGAEKLFEVRDYRQITVLANRHDWLSAFSNELGVVMAVERMLGMEVPERAVWLRTLLAELNRVLNHLMFLGSFPLEMGAITPMFYAFRERETLQAVLEEACGGRMHYMANRVGGLKEDVPAGWTDRVRPRSPTSGPGRPDLERLVRHNEIFLARATGGRACCPPRTPGRTG